MRYVPLALLTVLGCTTTTVARLSPARYAARSEDTPIQLYSSHLPTCAFEEIAIVTAQRESWMISWNAVVGALRKKARHLGGDALVRVGFGDNGEITGTVIRFARQDCTQ